MSLVSIWFALRGSPSGQAARDRSLQSTELHFNEEALADVEELDFLEDTLESGRIAIPNDGMSGSPSRVPVTGVLRSGSAGAESDVEVDSVLIDRR